MRPDQHLELVKKIGALRELVAGCSMYTVSYSCAAYLVFRDPPPASKVELLSPSRQWFFLLGLMLSTSEPTEAREFTNDDLQRAIDLLNDIFNAYAFAFFPAPGETLTDNLVRATDVALPAFLTYLGQGLSASTDQVNQRIERYLFPFDSQLKEDLQLSASEALAISTWLSAEFQSRIDRLKEKMQREKATRTELLSRAKVERWNTERLRSEVESLPGYRDDVLSALSEMSELFQITLAELESEFGVERARAFWNLFSIARGEAEQLQYPTDHSVAGERSLYRLSERVAICPWPHLLSLAVLQRFENHLVAGPRREGYFRRRDRILEEEVERHFRRLLRNHGDYFPSVYETPDQQFEHDLVIRIGRDVIVVEAKASPPVEAFRDPTKAFVRIRRAFRSDGGTQTAFDQAKRLWTRWKAGEQVRLYDSNGSLALEFDSTDVRAVHLVCVTRDNFGALAVDLSRLLEKDTDEPYPWAVNVLDLESIADSWDYFGWDEVRFWEFVRNRVELNGCIFSDDELDVVGFFIKHGGFESIPKSEQTCTQIDPFCSNVFDQIYYARSGGPPVEYRPSPPVTADLRESLRQRRLVSFEGAMPTPKQGRNEQCGCGSGKKYKRCCGY